MYVKSSAHVWLPTFVSPMPECYPMGPANGCRMVNQRLRSCMQGRGEGFWLSRCDFDACMVRKNVVNVLLKRHADRADSKFARVWRSLCLQLHCPTDSRRLPSTCVHVTNTRLNTGVCKHSFSRVHKVVNPEPSECGIITLCT
jgi:hypothetical protein